MRKWSTCFLAFVACIVPVDESGRSCPCSAGWTCCERAQICVREGTACPLPKPLEPSAATSFEVPTTRPRLWFSTPTALTQARRWFAEKHPGSSYAPRDDDVRANAFAYLMTGNTAWSQRAISWLMAFTVPGGDTAGPGYVSAEYRWNGENAMLVYDWCYDQFTPSQRATLIERWNRWVTNQNMRDVGGPATKEFWAQVRTSLEWGIVSFHENPSAQGFLDEALTARFQSRFLPYANAQGLGGVPAEGAHLGANFIGETIIPFQSLSAWGRNPFEETNFFRQTVFHLIYAVTPAPTLVKGLPPGVHLFPWAGDNHWFEGKSATSFEFGGLMQVATQWRQPTIAQYARGYLTRIRPDADEVFASLDVGGGGEGRSFDDLPLDYYAAGAGYLYARNQWSADSTVVLMQLGTPAGRLVDHADVGTFQLWRKGRWLSRESPGMTLALNGFEGVGSDSSDQTLAHNGILFEGIGARVSEAADAPKDSDGRAVVLRIDSGADHSYGVVDLIRAYRAVKSTAIIGNRLSQDNAHVAKVVRELLFIRPLEALVIFDRLESTAFDRQDVEVLRAVTLTPKVASASAVKKTFLMHFEEAPAISGPRATVTYGEQKVEVTTLVPAGAALQVVDERTNGDPSGQFRLEVTAAGQIQTHLLHLVSMRDSAEAALEHQLTESASGYTLRITRGTQTALIALEKGMTSRGGSFGYSPNGEPTAKRMRENIQQSIFTASGPVWVP